MSKKKNGNLYLIECKVVRHGEDDWGPPPSEVSPYCYWQAQTQMAASGASIVYVVVYFITNSRTERVIYEIPKTETHCTFIEEYAERMWGYVEAGRIPDASDERADVAALPALRRIPLVRDVIDKPDGTLKKLLKLREDAAAAKRSAEASHDLWTAALLRALHREKADAVSTGNGKVLAWMPTNRKAYTVEAKEYYSFREVKREKLEVKPKELEAQ